MSHSSIIAKVFELSLTTYAEAWVKRWPTYYLKYHKLTEGNTGQNLYAYLLWLAQGVAGRVWIWLPKCSDSKCLLDRKCRAKAWCVFLVQRTKEIFGVGLLKMSGRLEKSEEVVALGPDFGVL